MSAIPPTSDSSRLARRLLRSLDRASLATTLGGAPYVSLVLVATAADGQPLLLISQLAQHAANIAGDPRVALLFDGTVGLEEPLAGPRATVLGRAERSADEGLRARFLARHPSARLYADFADFHLYRIAVERAHLVGGFGRIEWIDATALLPAGLAALAVAEPELVRAANARYGAALTLCARILLGRDGDGWQLTGLDTEGADLRCAGAVARLDFAQPAEDADAAMRELGRFAQEARDRTAP